MKEEKEGRKGREEGRRLGHEEGRLTDIAALATSSNTHTHTPAQAETHTLCQIVHCTVAALFFFFLNPLQRLVLHPFFSSKREDKRHREEEEEEEEGKGRGGGEGGGGEPVTLSSPLLRHSRVR